MTTDEMIEAIDKSSIPEEIGAQIIDALLEADIQRMLKEMGK